jgi:predicted ATP-dependent endonuclease of OLD family
MLIESLKIKNYRLFRQAKLADLPRMTVVVGANGTSKSTLFDVLSPPIRRTFSMVPSLEEVFWLVKRGGAPKCTELLKMKRFGL